MELKDIEAAWRGSVECRACGIRDLVLFADLKEGDFELIHRPIEDLHFPPGSVLYRAGSPATHLFTVRRGLIKLIQYLPEGSQRIVRLARFGDVAGLEGLLGRPYEHTAIALQAAFVCRIPLAVATLLSNETPRLHRQLMARWHRAVQDADFWTRELSTGTARLRVARLLLYLAELSSDGRLHLPGREDVGAMLAVRTETASRVIADFRREGLIQAEEDGSMRADLAALRALVDDEQADPASCPPQTVELG